MNGGNGIMGTHTDLQTKNSLHGNEESRNIERFKENLCSFFSIPPWVERGFCQ
jgi:hypothetical protein